MRRTYRAEGFTFQNPGLQGWARGNPTRIIIHRQGNPGAHARAALKWGDSVGAFSIHDYIEDDLIIHAVDYKVHAYHANVGSADQAEVWGYPVLTPYGARRGDIDAIGIETCDINGGGPGQTYSLSQETRISLVIKLAELCVKFGLDPRKGHTIEEHGGYGDPTRVLDLGDAIYVPDVREDVADLIAGREPWRTVQQFAYGRPAPESWRPAPPAPPEPPTPPVDITKYRIVPVGEPVVDWTDEPDIREIRQRVRIVRDN